MGAKLSTRSKSTWGLKRAKVRGMWIKFLKDVYFESSVKAVGLSKDIWHAIAARPLFRKLVADERGDVPGWVLVVLMTTGLITAIWAIAEPRLSTLLRNSLDSMNTVR